jgi:hypothetical protein
MSPAPPLSLKPRDDWPWRYDINGLRFHIGSGYPGVDYRHDGGFLRSPEELAALMAVEASKTARRKAKLSSQNGGKP